MPTIVQSLTAPALRFAKNVAKDDPFAKLSLDESRFTTTAAGSLTSETVDDAVVSTEQNPTGYVEPAVLPESSVLGQPTFASSDESIFTVDASGQVTRISDGQAEVFATLPSGVTLKASIDVRTKTSAAQKSLTNWVNGSLAKAVSDEVDGAISGVTASDATKRIYNSSTLSPTAYNAACWASDYDWSGCAFNLNQAGTAITRRHVVMAAHYRVGVGTLLRFMLPDGSVFQTRVAGFAYYSSAGTAGQTGQWSALRDWCVLTLVDQLPVTAKVYKVCPADLLDRLSQIQWGVPLIVTDKQNHALILEYWANVNPLSRESNNGNERAAHRKSLSSSRAAFWETLIIGDSSDPLFLPVNGELILFACHTYSNSCLPYFHDIAGLNTLIAAADAHAGISTGLTVETADLSGFTDFS